MTIAIRQGNIERARGILEEFDREVFECLIEKIVIGEKSYSSNKSKWWNEI